MKKYSNIIDVSDEIEDIQEILPSNDILIVDYSSIIFDFILLNRPVIFFPFDYEVIVKNLPRILLQLSG